MLREKLKSAAILILIVNLIFLTVQLWFFDRTFSPSEDIIRYIRTIPVMENFFPVKQEYSISKENLSRPRKFLINDGSLWMAYYNTDIGFAPIESRTRKLVTGFLNGEISASKKIDYKTWEAGLESISIYVEYPVAFSMDMFRRIMGTDTNNYPTEIKSFSEIIILPSSDETDVCMLIRDASDKSSIYAYILNSNHTLPSADLAVYASSDVYYEPVFSTGLNLSESSKVTLSPLVLFSDSQPATAVLSAKNLLNTTSDRLLLEKFAFNAISVTPYEDTEGALNYIANYATSKIYPDSVFEYNAIEAEKGILLDESGDAYNVLNASIDFAENIWKTISPAPLSVLVTSDLSGYDSTKPYTFRFDYYESGMPVEIALPAAYGHPEMNCAIEMTVSGGRLVSFRQYMRSYSTVFHKQLPDTFVTALDGFVTMLDKDSSITKANIVDIYTGYLDYGNEGEISASWLAKTDEGTIYPYLSRQEVAVDELE